jgi:Catalytic LigB subunit of aromatic ring-opening dioxygenase
VGMQQRGFDPAFMLSLPDEVHGLGHAFMRPLSKLTAGQFHIPMLPVMVNCFYAPQPSAARCVGAARAIRAAIEAWPQDLRVAVVGSGGLWHTPGAQDAYIDEEFDQEMLLRLRRGDADAMADYFDHWQPAAPRKHLRCYESFPGGTGMPGGIGSGAGETRNWIMAAAVADRPASVIDYVPVHASPCGMGFAYWDMECPGQPA